MEEALNKAQQAIGQMIANLLLLATFSVKRDVRFWDIRIVIKPEAKSTPDVKKKKPSPSRLRQNQRGLQMLLERNKTTGSAEPDLSGIKETSAGKIPVLNRVDSTPVTWSSPVNFKVKGGCKHAYPIPHTIHGGVGDG